MPPVEPMPRPPRESRLVPPLDAQEASYFAASARISSLLFKSMRHQYTGSSFVLKPRALKSA
jgi:hypothetical protein